MQVRAADVELLSGSPEGHPVATAARRWAAFDGHTGALHQLNDSSDFVAVQLHGAVQLRISLLECSIALRTSRKLSLTRSPAGLPSTGCPSLASFLGAA